MRENGEHWIAALGLRPHPEGGSYRETYRAAETIAADALPARYGGRRDFATAIYYLLRRGEVSVLHRLRSDEIFHFYEGSPLLVDQIRPDGSHVRLRLGRDARGGEALQGVVPAGTWFGATVQEPGAYSLVGCTVAPGFDFADFERADRARLIERYPRHRSLIERLT